MKIISVSIIWIVSVMCLIGCGTDADNKGPSFTGQKSVTEVLEEGMAKADNTVSADNSEAHPDISDEDVNDNLEDNEAETYETENIGGSERGTVNADAPLPEVSPDSYEETKSKDGIDVDLTELSSTMVYSEVYYMMVTPEEYMGKTIRMNGLYTVYKDEDTGEYYHACIIQDATACCAQGVEFRLAGESTYPDDYPEEGDDITVTGTFGTYTEDGYEYCALLEARMDESIT